jgi:hypothetical protein
VRLRLPCVRSWFLERARTHDLSRPAVKDGQARGIESGRMPVAHTQSPYRTQEFR